MKIAFCGYDFFVDCLDAIAAQGHQVVALFTEDADNEYNFNKEIIQRSIELDVSVKFAPINEADIEKLQELGCDVLVSAAYSHKIPSLEGTGIKGINIHPTKLPEGRGPWPLPWLILKEKQETALTFHKITNQFDAGDILDQVTVPMVKNETLESLSARLQMYAPEALVNVLNDIDDLWDKAKPQSEGEYWPMFGEDADIRQLNPEDTVETIEKTVRAFGKFECPIDLDGLRYWVQRIDVWPEAHDFECGDIVHQTAKEFTFAAKDGFVCVTHYTVDED